MSEKIVFADLFIECTQSLKISLEPERIDTFLSTEEKGFSLRKIYSDFSIDFSFSPLSSFSKDVLINFKETFPKSYEKIQENLTKLSDPPPIEKRNFLKFLKKLEEELKAQKEFKKIRHYKLNLQFLKRNFKVFNFKEGGESSVSETRNYLYLSGLVVMEESGALETGYESLGLLLTDEDLSQKEIKNVLLEALRLVLLKISGRYVKPGKMPVVISGDAGGTMIHEAVGHGFEADHAETGSSVYSGKLNQKVASSKITVIDDPTIEGLFGSYSFDDEGERAQKVILIKDGVLTDYLYDITTALKYKKSSNGHGRRESFRHIPIPRMGNTYIAPGNKNPEDIIKSLSKGLLVKKVGGGEVNPVTGDFVFEIREAYFIEGGEVKYPVKGVTISGNGPEVLKRIEEVGNDLKFEAGICGKDGQGVPVGDAQPTLLIPELVVGGKE